MKGELITNPRTIIKLAKEGKAIWNDLGKYRQPAAFIQNYPFVRLMLLISNKRIFTYLPKKKKCLQK